MAAPNPSPDAPPEQIDTLPPVRLAGPLRWVETLLARLNAATERLLPDALNPIARVGALANYMLLLACLSGALLLIWYVPSHESAHASVAVMDATPFGAGLVRSLHRYSSDAAMFLIALHACIMLAQRRLGGPRWVAWVTGIVGVGILWFIGWLGYWLVWDTRAQLVAKGTAKALDVLPIFVDPISTSFLTDSSVPSLLFFVVFFLHILLPLLLVVALWLHLSRLSRAVWLPGRALSITSLIALVVLAVIVPAQATESASMTLHPDNLSGDWWYILPVALTERLSGGALWAVVLVVGTGTLAMPWWFVRRRPKRIDRRRHRATGSEHRDAHHDAHDDASDDGNADTSTDDAAATTPGLIDITSDNSVAAVEAAKCNACQSCARDCPFDAIAMMPRTDGRRFPSVAVVDPSRCVGCGVCNGSCDSSAIVLPWLPQPAVRRRVDTWLTGKPAAANRTASLEDTPARAATAAPEPRVGAQTRAPNTDEKGLIVFGCVRSAAGRMPHDAATGRALSHPDTRLVSVPCAGWLHPMTIERALRRGASGVVVVSCNPVNCTSREGARWTNERLDGLREPRLRTEHVDATRLLRVELDGHEHDKLDTALRAFHESLNVGDAEPRPTRTAQLEPKRKRSPFIALGVVALILGLATWLPSNLPLPTRGSPGPELVVAFKLAGQTIEDCIERTPEELRALPPHKRIARVCERRRTGVQLTVDIDGKRVADRVHEAGGAFADGASRALERFIVAPGEHHVVVAIGAPGAEPIHRIEATRTFGPTRSEVLLLDATTGFQWH